MDKGFEYGKEVLVAPKTGLDTAGKGTAITSGVVEGVSGKNGPHESKLAEHTPFKFPNGERVEPTGGPADAVRTGAVPAIREAVFKSAVNVNNAPVLSLQNAPGLSAADGRGVEVFKPKQLESKIESHSFHKPPTSNEMPFSTSNKDIRGKATIGPLEIVSRQTERTDESRVEDHEENKGAYEESLKREEA